MNFKRFSTSDNQWHDIPYYQHKTATDTLTLPAVIYPNDTSITVGIKGNEEHTGTPTSQNPVMPNGTGDMSGNLFDKTGENVGYYVDSSGNLAGGTSAAGWTASDYIEIAENTQYTFNPNTTAGNSAKHCFYNAQKQPFASNIINSGQQTFTTPSGAKYARFSYRDSSTDIMLNLGSQPLPYEPYGQYKIPISSANTTTPVYLGEVQSTRRIKKLVFDGTEAWRLYAFSSATNVERFYLVVSENAVSPYSIISSHFPTQAGNSDTEHTRFGGSPINEVYIYISRTVATTVADLKAYLAQQYANGTPVTVWYVLATATTGTVNEPLMKIGDYADSLTTSIPCTAGENTLDVQTTVAPSEVTANYQGWHPVQSVHEHDSNYTIATMQALTIAQLQTHTISDLQGGEWS